jgi:hypothetical protein
MTHTPTAAPAQEPLSLAAVVQEAATALYGNSTFAGLWHHAAPFVEARGGEWLCIHFRSYDDWKRATNALTLLERASERTAQQQQQEAPSALVLTDEDWQEIADETGTFIWGRLQEAIERKLAAKLAAAQQPYEFTKNAAEELFRVSAAGEWSWNPKLQPLVDHIRSVEQQRSDWLLQQAATIARQAQQRQREEQ